MNLKKLEVMEALEKIIVQLRRLQSDVLDDRPIDVHKKVTLPLENVIAISKNLEAKGYFNGIR